MQTDVIIIDCLKHLCLILDTIIKLETDNTNQDKKVNKEKKPIYFPIIYLQSQYGIKQWYSTSRSQPNFGSRKL